MGQPDDFLDIKLAVDAIMARKGGVAGGGFRMLVSSLRDHGIVAYREKFAAKYLSGLSFKAGTIVDVGVNQGTRELWDAFPGMQILLVEPLVEVLDRTVSDNPGYAFVALAAAAGSKSGEMKLNVMPDSAHSSFLNRTQEASDVRDVKIVRLDEVLSAGAFAKPYGIKVDTEGFELEVLEGCRGIMNDVEFVIAEVSVKKIFKDGYKFSQIVALMAEYGFEIMDILSSSGGPPNNFDCLFVKNDDSHLSFG